MHAIKNIMNEIEKKFKKKISSDITETKWTRNCPKCGTGLFYKNNRNLKLALQKNSNCIKCRNSRTANPMYGKRHTENTKRKMKEKTGGCLAPNFGKLGKDASAYGMRHSEESKQKMREMATGKNNPFFGKHHSKETRKKLRIAQLNWVAKSVLNGGQVYPTYNSIACQIFEEINKELGWKGIHAENGGEYHIKQLGYFVDYYEPNFNIVIEYDEKYHVQAKQKERDIGRQKEIEEFLRCKFYRIKQDQNWKEIING